MSAEPIRPVRIAGLSRGGRRTPRARRCSDEIDDWQRRCKRRDVDGPAWCLVQRIGSKAGEKGLGAQAPRSVSISSSISGPIPFSANRRWRTPPRLGEPLRKRQPAPRRPKAEQLAVPLHQRLALECGQGFAALISAGPPHAKDRRGVRLSKATHEASVDGGSAGPIPPTSGEMTRSCRSFMAIAASGARARA